MQRRTVRTRGARSSYGGPSTSSCNNNPPPFNNTLTYEQLGNIFTPHNLEGGGMYHQQSQPQQESFDNNAAQGSNEPSGDWPPTREEMAKCEAKVHESNLERLYCIYPQLQPDSLAKMYELCDRNIIRTIDNINFYSNVNVVLQAAYSNMRAAAFSEEATSSPTLFQEFESFAKDFFKDIPPKTSNTSVGVEPQPEIADISTMNIDSLL